MGRCIRHWSLLGKSNNSHLEKTKTKCTKIQTKMYAAQLQMFIHFLCIFLVFIFLLQHSQCAQCKEEKRPHTHRQRKKGDVLTEKHPVLLGVWPAALFSCEAHVCCCYVSGLSAGSGACKSCCCWLTDWSTGYWQAVAERVSRRALCLSRGIETRQLLLACDMGGWSVCVSALLALLIVPLLQFLRWWEQTHFLEKLIFAQIRGLWVILYYCIWSDLFFFLSPSGKLQLFRALFRQKQMELTGVSCKPITEVGLCGMPLLWLLASWIMLQLFENTLMEPICGNITNKKEKKNKIKRTSSNGTEWYGHS